MTDNNDDGIKSKGFDYDSLVEDGLKDVVKKVFSGESEEQREAFKLLCEAYIGGRYDRNYKITLEQLHYLIEEVEKLQAIAEQICSERLSLKDFPGTK